MNASYDITIDNYQLFCKEFIINKCKEYNGDWIPNWNDRTQPKYYFMYNYEYKKFFWDDSYSEQMCGVFYVRDYRILYILLAKHRKELLIMFGVNHEA